MHQTLIFGQDVAKSKDAGRVREPWKNPFASRLTEFDITLKLFRITDQWYIAPVKFPFGRNRDFFWLLLLPLAGGPKGGKRFDADWTNWRLISSASFHTSSDNCERNTQKWNSNNKGCKKKTIETLIWLRRSCEIKLRRRNVSQRRVSKLLNEPPYCRQNQTKRRCMFRTTSVTKS